MGVLDTFMDIELDLKSLSVKDIQARISKYIIGHSRPQREISPEAFFRTRIITSCNPYDLKTTAAIWYPDRDLIGKENHGQGRCNEKGQNFFYCSNSLEATIHELRPKNQDLILIGHFKIMDQQTVLKSQFAGIEVLRKSGSHVEAFKKFDYIKPSDKEFEEFIAAKFQEIISEEEEYKYKLTNAISNILINDGQYDCLIYPSVAGNYEFENYGIRSDFVDDHMCCYHQHIYRVIRSERHYHLSPVAYGVVHPNMEVLKYSKVTWKKIKEFSESNILEYKIE